MIEKTVLDYLSEVLPAFMELPAVLPEEPFAVIEKTGGGKENHISRATLAIQSYGATLWEAAQTNERVKARMETVTELDSISGCRLISDYNFTDTETKRYRYQAVYQLVHY